MPLRALFVALFVCLAPTLYGQACTSIVLSPASATAKAAGDNLTFSANGAPLGCSKSAVSDVPWITISFGGGTSNPVTFGITVAANSSAAARSGTVTVNETFVYTVNQQGVNCSYNIQPSSATVSSSSGSGTINLTSPNGCNWNAAVSESWVQVQSTSGVGSASITYNYEANAAAVSRSATITIGGSNYTLNQNAACSFSANPNSQNINSTAIIGTIAITANVSSCVRTAASDATWLTISSGASGTGNGTVAWAAAINNTPAERVGHITIGDAVFTLVQAAGTCYYQVSPTSAAVSALGASGAFSLISNCTWQATSNASWLTVTSATAGSGNAAVTWRAEQNPLPQQRTGNITIGSAVFAVSQAGASCDVTLSATSFTAPIEGLLGSFDVATTAGCTWSASSTVPWITFQTAAAGNGEGSVSFTVAPNNTASARTGSVIVNNKIISFSQAAQTCSINISPQSASVDKNAATGSIAVTTNCAWTVQSSAPAWLSSTGASSGNSNGQVDYAIAANGTAQTRTATLRIGTQTFTVTQSGGTCSLTLAPSTTTIAGPAGNGRFNVQGSTGCSWEPQSNASWLSVAAWSSVNGSGAVDFAAVQNPGVSSRAGTIKVNSETFTVTQTGSKPAIASGGIVNAASFAGGPISPGLIVTVFGSFIGPEQLALAKLSDDGKSLTKIIANARVLFDDVPGAMIYANATQASVVVPYAVAGKASTKVKVEYLEAVSDEVTVPVTAAAPAIFTLEASGKGQGAVLNQDAKVNGPTNAAQRNTIIQIFATGEGLTAPAGVDGKLAVAPLPAPAGRVSVRIGNIDSPIIYAGAAPGLVAGVMQINVRVPTTAPIGNAIALVIQVGNAISPANVTIAVRQ